MFLLADESRDGAAGFFKTGEIPEVRKIAALLRLDGLHGAIVAVQKNAAAVRLFLQRETAAIPTQPRKLLDELGFVQTLERGEPRDFRLRQTHLARPAAAGRAALTFIKNRHARRLAGSKSWPIKFSTAGGAHFPATPLRYAKISSGKSSLYPPSSRLKKGIFISRNSRPSQ